MKKKKRPETENKGEKTSALFVLYSEKVFQERKKIKLGFQTWVSKEIKFEDN